MKKYLILFAMLIIFISCVSVYAADTKDSKSVPDMASVFVKGGCFQMGDFSGDGSVDEKPVHQVCVNDFYIGKYLVTQAQWRAVMGSDPAAQAKAKGITSSGPSFFKACGDNCPVENITWKEIDEFLGKLNTKTGKDYRLPTEAEWEYAARSRGKNEKWSGTGNRAELGDYAWLSQNSDYKTHPVGLKKPNAIGLYDMTGNVWEWTKDWYAKDYYSKSPKNNPEGPNTGKKYVLRGGSWFQDAAGARVTARYQGDPLLRVNDVGIRLVRTR